MSISNNRGVIGHTMQFVVALILLVIMVLFFSLLSHLQQLQSQEDIQNMHVSTDKTASLRVLLRTPYEERPLGRVLAHAVQTGSGEGAVEQQLRMRLEQWDTIDNPLSMRIKQYPEESTIMTIKEPECEQRKLIGTQLVPLQKEETIQYLEVQLFQHSKCT